MGLLLLDLDGTLVEDALVEEEGKLQRPQSQLFHEPRLRPNVFEVIERQALEGDRFAIVTNQGGVAWGYHTKAEVGQRISRAIAELDFFFGRPFSVHVSWLHPRATVPVFKGEDDRRKPAPGMLLEAMAAHGFTHVHNSMPGETTPIPDVLMVGDREEDEGAASAAFVGFTHAGDFFVW